MKVRISASCGSPGTGSSSVARLSGQLAEIIKLQRFLVRSIPIFFAGYGHSAGSLGYHRVSDTYI